MTHLYEGPFDADPGMSMLSKFGCVEFEDIATSVLRYLADPTRKANFPAHLGDYGTGWGKKLTIDSLPGVSPVWFAMFCASGWLANTWFPKGPFVASEAFIKRIKEEE